MARDTQTTAFARAGGANLPYAAAVHANLVEQKWSNLMFKHGLATNPLKNFMGAGDGSIIQVDKNFLKAKGDTITFHLRALLSGSGQGDDGTHEGNEEAMTFHDNSVVIHERGHATKVNGIMTEQRTSIPLRAQGKSALGEWVGRIMAGDVISALSGLTGDVDAEATKSFAGQITGAAAVDAYTSGIETVNPSAPTGGTATTVNTPGSRHFCGGQTTAGVFAVVAGTSAVISAGGVHKFGTLVISHLKRMATATITNAGVAVSPMRPVMVDGKKYFLMLVSPWQARDLKLETAWILAQKDANVRGNKNPLFSGALGIWDGVIIHECDLIHMRYGINGVAASEYFTSGVTVAVTSSDYVARGLFLGAQAGLLAFGKKPTWKEKMHDYGAKWGISTRTIYGAKKAVFNSSDFGVIAVDTNVIPA